MRNTWTTMLTCVVMVILATGLFAKNSASEILDNKPVTISADSTSREITVNGQDVLITGSYNQIQILGTTGNLVITGSYNDINIDTVESIVVRGNYNFVTWMAGGTPVAEPTVIDKGGYNNVGKR
jgi:hypothetical protein